MKVPVQYVREANVALLAALAVAVEREDWDYVEAITSALCELAQTFTKPGGENA